HNSHADYVLKAARAGKHVFVEKPLCLTREELRDIEAIYLGKQFSEQSNWDRKSEIGDRKLKVVQSSTQSPERNSNSGATDLPTKATQLPSSSSHAPSSILMVGYNRRFAPLSLSLKAALKGRIRPLSILYRVNAGLIDRNNWIQDPEIGGGRILSEVCHFIDYAIFLVGKQVKSVYATSSSYNQVDIPNEDSVHITLSFEDDSVAVVQYLCDGDRAVPKEWLEVMVEQMTFQIDDFRSGFSYSNGKRGKLPGSGRKQNKGYAGEIQAFFEAIQRGGPVPIAAEEIFHGMDVTFLVRESLGSGQVIRVGQAPRQEVITVAGVLPDEVESHKEQIHT
ncbi:Gfo/Idh/MocA family oxidoreductase, partial [bacterium]|nr:Gfo/Idh/MocA family oxidoreductase [bacterium]